MSISAEGEHTIPRNRDEDSETRITLSWPDRDLNPNSRVHWSAKAKAVKAARHEAGWALRRTFRTKPGWDRVAVDMVFCPPDERRRDRDNLIASSKAIQDGIADALGVDDSKFTTTYSIGEPVKGGTVVVTIRSA
jgi:crossover junction endodeoxyribonuclease RusA